MALERVAVKGKDNRAPSDREVLIDSVVFYSIHGNEENDRAVIYRVRTTSEVVRLETLLDDLYFPLRGVAQR